VEDKEIATVLTTPENIRTLQRKLYRKAKQDPAFRFYALYDKIYREDILSHAYRLVSANKGSAGIDGITFKAIRENEGETAFLAELQEALKEKTYQVEPVKRVLIPKGNGESRPLGIPTIRDRVAQMAVKLVIEPIFEADFCENSYGFRPKRSAHDAIDDIAKTMYHGYTQVIDADLSKYFDTIPHAKLMTTVAERISDGAILHIIKMWLKAPVIEEDKHGTKRTVGGGKSNRRGTPQGGVISPLLANIYLHILDRIWERLKLKDRLGAHLVRYADDFVVLCRKGTDQSMKMIQYVLNRLGLTLNTEKTHIVDATQKHFDFLGFELGIARSSRTGGKYCNVQPSRKALKAIKTRLTDMTRRNLTCLPLDIIIGNVNRTLRGWVAYFHYRNCSKSLAKVKTHAADRLRTHLRKRHKVRQMLTGYKRFPDRSLYDKYGLYKVPTTAGWTKAHAVR
jgi:group II intron reverse transcriptase/maturase